MCVHVGRLFLSGVQINEMFVWYSNVCVVFCQFPFCSLVGCLVFFRMSLTVVKSNGQPPWRWITGRLLLFFPLMYVRPNNNDCLLPENKQDDRSAAKTEPFRLSNEINKSEINCFHFLSKLIDWNSKLRTLNFKGVQEKIHCRHNLINVNLKF